MPKKLARDFFLRPTNEVAKGLLGKTLTTLVGGQKTVGRIVEVEAYLGHGDDACHASRGQTKRNKVMFAEGGHCYVYLIYGMYYCVNVVTEASGYGSAVLIRAVEPIEGLDVMKIRRGLPPTITPRQSFNLTSGPGKLCQAFAIDQKMSGQQFLTSKLIQLTEGDRISEKDILQGPRIGISKATDLEWRYFIKNNNWVSRP